MIIRELNKLDTWAIKLNEKIRYEIEGTKRKSVLVDGKFYDEYYMGKIID